MLIQDKIAFDSVRSKDENGFLHIAVSNITKEQVVPYKGSTIPDYEALGLDANKLYMIYRPAEAIEKAASSFNGLPLAFEHHDMDAQNLPKEFIIGSLGTDCRFEKPYLKNSLTVTDGKAIEQIENGTFRELSAGYFADIKMDGGIYDGTAYDGYMSNIRGNHVALVAKGRAGSDVKIADEAPKGGERMGIVEQMKTLLTSFLTSEKVAELLANGEIQAEEKQEAGIAEPVTADTAKTEQAETAENANNDAEADVQAVENPPTGELIGENEVPQETAENAIDGEKPETDEKPDAEQGVEVSPEIAEKMAKAGLNPKIPIEVKAFIAGMAQADTKEAVKDEAPYDYKAVYEASEKVAPIIGKLADPFVFKDASEIYEKALKHEGVILDGVDRSAYGAMVAMIGRKPVIENEPKKADALTERLLSIQVK